MDACTEMDADASSVCTFKDLRNSVHTTSSRCKDVCFNCETYIDSEVHALNVLHGNMLESIFSFPLLLTIFADW